MKIVVQKYGGTSVANKEKISQAIQKIKEKVDEKYSVVVVVSAQGKTTDNLYNLSAEYASENKCSRELDMLLSTGEMQSAALVAMALKKAKIDAVALTGALAGIVTDSTYGKAEILGVYPEKIKENLALGKVVVVTGFQGIDKYGYISTLGRGGSDLTAVVLAKVLKADVCEIFSDIDGVYVADPKVVKEAKILEKIRYDEMLELSTAGAKVLHNGSVIASHSSDAKLVVRNVGTDAKGTEILKSKDIYEDTVVKITKKDKLSKVTLVGSGYISKKGKVKEIVDILEEMNINAYMIQISEISISLLVDEDQAVKVMNTLNMKLNK
ncbi:MAG: aspartate kinase [Clostridia bacterium]